MPPDKIEALLDALNARIRVQAMPMLRDMRQRVSGLTILAICQLLALALVIGLLAVILARGI